MMEIEFEFNFDGKTRAVSEIEIKIHFCRMNSGQLFTIDANDFD